MRCNNCGAYSLPLVDEWRGIEAGLFIDEPDEFAVGADVFFKLSFHHGIITRIQNNGYVWVKYDNDREWIALRSDLYTLATLPRKDWKDREEGDMVIFTGSSRKIDQGNSNGHLSKWSVGWIDENHHSVFKNILHPVHFWGLGVFILLSVKHPDWLKKQVELDIFTLLDRLNTKIDKMFERRDA